jgi:biopolymer transport protein ExbB/TolQ
MNSKDLRRSLVLASPALIPIVPGVTLLIQLGKLSAWTLFFSEFLSLVILVGFALYLTRADRERVSSMEDSDRIPMYLRVAIIALVVTNILAHFVAESLLIELRYGRGSVF